MAFHLISAWSPLSWLRVGHAGVRNGGYLVYHPSRSDLAPVPCGSFMVFFKPDNFSPIIPHVVSVVVSWSHPITNLSHTLDSALSHPLLLEGIKNFLQDKLKPHVLQPGLCSECKRSSLCHASCPARQAAACPAL